MNIDVFIRDISLKIFFLKRNLHIFIKLFFKNLNIKNKLMVNSRE